LKPSLPDVRSLSSAKQDITPLRQRIAGLETELKTGRNYKSKNAGGTDWSDGFLARFNALTNSLELDRSRMIAGFLRRKWIRKPDQRLKNQLRAVLVWQARPPR
jgi:hypothetical protein